MSDNHHRKDPKVGMLVRSPNLDYYIIVRERKGIFSFYHIESDSYYDGERLLLDDIVLYDPDCPKDD